MHPLLKITLQLFVAFVVIFFLIQPYNWFCQLSGSCKPFYFSYYLPKREGKVQLRLFFETLSYRENIEFFSDQTELTTVANRKNLVTYTLRNNSKKFIVIRPKMTIEPAVVEKYIKSYQCLCFQKYKLKPGQEVTVQMEFEIDKKIDTDQFEERVREEKIKIRFKI